MCGAYPVLGVTPGSDPKKGVGVNIPEISGILLFCSYFCFSGGLFATVRKCTHRESGVTYAAKFANRVREGVDCSMEVLHEIAMLSVCRESNKIVHLKDVFQNRQQIILVLE